MVFFFVGDEDPLETNKDEYGNLIPITRIGMGIDSFGVPKPREFYSPLTPRGYRWHQKLTCHMSRRIQFDAHISPTKCHEMYKYSSETLRYIIVIAGSAQLKTDYCSKRIAGQTDTASNYLVHPDQILRTGEHHSYTYMNS